MRVERVTTLLYNEVVTLFLGGERMLQFEHIAKSYKTKQILRDINLTIPKGQFVAIIGESGCGKTTLLKMINRLIKPTSGAIYINGENIQTMNEVALRRKIGYVIQQTGLFPHMTVRQNIEIIPKLEKYKPAELEENTKKLMHMVGLDCNEFLDRYPTELSGGQLAISKAKFQLEPGSVIIQHLTSIHGIVCREIKLPLVCSSVHRIPDG